MKIGDSCWPSAPFASHHVILVPSLCSWKENTRLFKRQAFFWACLISRRAIMRAWAILAVALWLPASHAYPMYGEEIPNGDHVPHPCKPNYLWHGVGHQNAQGGGARNPFGEDFAANGHKWTEALCRMDSDGDGRTNGQELGDPRCEWSKGQTPAVISGITHPGVCDPWNEGACMGKNSWLDCSKDEDMDCEALNDPEVLNVTLRFPRTKVPAKETTYICFNFQLPDDREYHLVATMPFIDNRNVMHHIVLSRCENSVGMMSEPEECLMGSEGCSETLEVWGLGLSGSCLDPNAGYLIGKGHTRTVSMQFHWTNPSLEDTWYDSSGMVLYYTPRLRRYNAGILTIGQTLLAIPPRQSSWVHEGGCSARCTNKIFKGDIQIFQVLNHMHYLGIRQNVTLTRNGGQTEVIVDDNPYTYDKPVPHGYQPPVTVRAGDALTTSCTFQSRSRNQTTLYGEGSFDEMCFTFVFYYPQENLARQTCSQRGQMDSCILRDVCDDQVYNRSAPAIAAAISKITANCDATGATCRAECPQAVREVKSDNPCFREAWGYYSSNVFEYAWDPVLLKFASAMQSCDARPGAVTMEPPSSPRHTTPWPATTRPSSEGPKPGMSEGPGAWLLSLVKSLDARPLLQNIIMNVNYNNNYGPRPGHSGHHDEDDAHDPAMH